MPSEAVRKHQDGGELSRLENFIFTTLAADPNPATYPEGSPWFNTTDGKWKYVEAGAVKEFANTGSIVTTGRYRGAYDASGNVVPTTADGSNHVGEDMKAGDYFRVSVAGAISGLIGEDALEAGDLVIADIDDADAAAEFFGMQANKPEFVNQSGVDQVTNVVVVADVWNDVTPAALDGGKISDFEIIDPATNDVLTNAYQTRLDQTVPKLQILSVEAHADLTVEFVGTT